MPQNQRRSSFQGLCESAVGGRPHLVRRPTPETIHKYYVILSGNTYYIYIYISYNYSLFLILQSTFLILIIIIIIGATRKRILSFFHSIVEHNEFLEVILYLQAGSSELAGFLLKGGVFHPEILKPEILKLKILILIFLGHFQALFCDFCCFLIHDSSGNDGRGRVKSILYNKLKFNFF